MTTADNYKHYAMTCQHVSCFLNKELSSAESRVLLFIINRTIRFNKNKEKIPSRHFLDGIVSGEGKPIIGGIGVSKRSLVRAIASLKEKQLIRVSLIGSLGTNYFTLLVDNVWRLINMAVDKLKVSRKRRNQTSAKEHPHQCQMAPTYKEEDIEVEETSKETTAKGGFRTTEEGIKAGLRKNKKALELNNSKAHLATLPNLLTVWRKSIRDYLYDKPDTHITQPTTKTYYRLSHNLKHRFGGNPQWKDIIYQTITEWDDVIEYFHWMDNIPSVPSLDFIQKNFKRVTEFTQREEATNVIDTKRAEELKAIQEAAAAEGEVHKLTRERDKLVEEIGYARELKYAEGKEDAVKSREEKLTAMQEELSTQKEEIKRLRSLTSFEEAEGHDLPEWNSRDN